MLRYLIEGGAKMRWFFWYIKQVFCTHNFEYEEESYTEQHYGRVTRKGIRISATCKKCGLHRSYWKY